MENLRVIAMLVASFCVLFGYFRFIVDENGNVPLNNFRFTGGMNLVIRGMIDGTLDLFAGSLSGDGVSTLCMYMGILLFYLGFNF